MGESRLTSVPLPAWKKNFRSCHRVLTVYREGGGSAVWRRLGYEEVNHFYLLFRRRTEGDLLDLP